MGTDPIGLLSYCKEHGIAAQAYSPLGDDSSELISGKFVTAAGAAHGKSGAQVALKWIWQHGVVPLGICAQRRWQRCIRERRPGGHWKSAELANKDVRHRWHELSDGGWDVARVDWR